MTQLALLPQGPSTDTRPLKSQAKSRPRVKETSEASGTLEKRMRIIPPSTHRESTKTKGIQAELQPSEDDLAETAKWMSTDLAQYYPKTEKDVAELGSLEGLSKEQIDAKMFFFAWDRKLSVAMNMSAQHT